MKIEDITPDTAHCLEKLPIVVDIGFSGIRFGSVGRVDQVRKTRRSCLITVTVIQQTEENFMPGTSRNETVTKTVDLERFKANCRLTVISGLGF